MLNAAPRALSTLTIVLACVAGLLATGCASSVDGSVDAVAAQTPDPDGAYCQAVQTVLIAQPSGAFEGEELSVSMNLYAHAVERLAELSPPEDALVLFELAATARLVGEDPGDQLQAQRLGNMFMPVASITIGASQACGIDG